MVLKSWKAYYGQNTANKSPEKHVNVLFKICGLSMQNVSEYILNQITS